MAKIQVSTVKMTADVEVINVSSYLVAKVVRAHDCVDTLIELNKHVKQTYNEETEKWEPVLDENGNPKFEYRDDTTQMIEERVYPLLKELVAAFGVEQLPL
jgi:hypothetical protein